MNKRFSEQQIQNWHAYEDVRAGGEYNMLMPEARAQTGLSRGQYLFVMKNYEALKSQAHTLTPS